jgi:hypothetical protein
MVGEIPMPFPRAAYRVAATTLDGGTSRALQLGRVCGTVVSVEPLSSAGSWPGQVRLTRRHQVSRIGRPRWPGGQRGYCLGQLDV